MEKASIRKRILNNRKRLDSLTHTELSQRVQQRLINSDCFSHARTLALYSPINKEVATEDIFIEARSAGKKVFYPKVSDGGLEFIEVLEVGCLSSGAFGVAEPSAGQRLEAGSLDLIVVPGLAFDLRGHRLGYGRGFYDRELAGRSSRSVAVGLCFDLQLCPVLPEEAHDQKLDFIATETRFIPCHIGVTGSS